MCLTLPDGASSSSAGYRVALPVEFPTARPPAPAVPPPPPAAERALVCDPDAVAARFLAHALTSAGFTVTTCHTAAACEAALRTEEPAVLVLALLLPDMDGLALLRRIRAETPAGGAGPVVIMVSALQAELRALDAGAGAFLHKPIKGSRLAAVARELLSRSHGSSPRSHERSA